MANPTGSKARQGEDGPSVDTPGWAARADGQPPAERDGRPGASRDTPDRIRRTGRLATTSFEGKASRAHAGPPVLSQSSGLAKEHEQGAAFDRRLVVRGAARDCDALATGSASGEVSATGTEILPACSHPPKGAPPGGPSRCAQNRVGRSRSLGLAGGVTTLRAAPRRRSRLRLPSWAGELALQIRRRERRDVYLTAR